MANTTNYSLEQIQKAYKILQEIEPDIKSDSEDFQEKVKSILRAKERISPRYIESLDANEVFVFSSNDKGVHCGRASLTAFQSFGAKQLVSEGLQGNSYAIITTSLKSEEFDNLKEEEKLVFTDVIIKARNKEITLSEQYQKISDSLDYSPMKMEEIAPGIVRFIDFAKDNKDTIFYVTRIGCGFSNHADETVAKHFKKALILENVYLPQSFVDSLLGTTPTGKPKDLAPSQSHGINSFVQDLNLQLTKYSNWLLDGILKPNRGEDDVVDKTKESEEDKRRRFLYDDVESISNHIVNAVNMYLKGLPAEAFNCINRALDKAIVEKDDKGKSLRLSDIKKDDKLKFYRMRKEDDNWVKREVDVFGMFHIPRSLRGSVRNQRYSIGGYPGLYLGSSIFACWEETGRPNLNNCLISRVKHIKDFKVLDLTIPSEAEWDTTDKDKLYDLIRRFPLIIACTFRASDNKALFKPEYIIPQLVLQWVKEQAYKDNKGKETKDKVIYGIKYTSVNYGLFDNKDAASFNFDKDKYTNYVLPIQDVKNEYCSVLCNTFNITEPICEEYERIKQTFSESSKEQNVSYNDTIFGKLEGILENHGLHTIKQEGK